MKKFLALVLTLAMVLTLNVGMIVSTAADAPNVDVTGKTTVTIDGVEYKVIADLAAVSTKGNYILSGDVAVANDAVITFAAGTVLNGNGYAITVEGNDLTAPLAAAPFALAAGKDIVITNVSFGTADAPICLRSEAPVIEGEDAADLAIFANDEAPQLDMEGLPMLDDYVPVNATFDNVNFNVIASDRLQVNVAAVMAVANGNFTLTNCTADVDFNVGDMTVGNGTDLTQGYAGGFFGYAASTSNVSFENCATAVGSVITNDWRTAGFVAGVAGGISVVNCTNNATLTNRTLCTGGILGWVEGETLSSWTFDGNVNNGDITAYMGPKDSADKNHGDNGRTAGGMVGYIYKDADNSAPQIIVSNCTNNGNLYGEDRLAGIFGDCRISYYTYTAEDGTKTYGKNTSIVENCVNTGDVLCVVLDAVSGAHVLGGMSSRTQGPTHYINCVNYGRVDANGMDDGHLGGIVGNTSASQGAINNAEDTLLVDGCINYGPIMNGRRIAGMVGASESLITFKNSANYGTVVSGTSPRSDNMAGGFEGFADREPHNYENCFNFGNVTATVNGGGFVGGTRNYDRSEIIMTGCLNAGNITAADNVAGGLVGNCTVNVTIKDSMNIGKIAATNSNIVSQILGNGDAIINIENCYAFGTIDENAFPPNLDGVLGFLCFTDVVVPEGATMVTVVGAAEDLTDERNKAVTAEEAVAIIKNLYGEATPIYAVDGVVELVDPSIRGVQTALAGATDGKIAVRFTGLVDDMGYEKVTFTYTVNNGEAVTVDGVPMLDVKATSLSGNLEVRDAAYVGGAALYCAAFDVAAEGEVVIEITMTATSNGVDYESFAVTVALVDGVIVG